MHRPSIYDRLHRYRKPEAPAMDASPRFEAGRLALVAALALTPAGVVSTSGVPEAVAPAQDAGLSGRRGEPVPVYCISGLNEALPGVPGDPVAHRECRLLATLLDELLLVTADIPEEAVVDVVWTTALASPARERAVERLKGVLERWRLPVTFQRIEAGPPADCANLHECLAPAPGSGARWVIWLSASSLVNGPGVDLLTREGALKTVMHPQGLAPGEAASAVVFRRFVPDESRGVAETGWTLYRGQRTASVSRRKGSGLSQALAECIGGYTASVCDEPPEADAIVTDTPGLPGRSGELAGMLSVRYPQMDLVEHGADLERFCGWPGDAAYGVQVALGAAMAGVGGSALLLQLRDDGITGVQWLVGSPSPGGDEVVSGAG
ncbi:hypothetical protein [Arhodomonas aquaeolei]|uniref:hypothetical protein n=1 Tax=Arhodomonas aquaeolei TaxID=2369 RepID=UPI00037D9971|nr:hypothetical protein [Arhodomonas aquaeolei]